MQLIHKIYCYLLAPLAIPPPQCTMDSDCASKLACFNGDCKNPCYEIKPCGAYAECTVVDTLPHRTMSCQCIPGYVGDADIQCKLGNRNVFQNKYNLFKFYF